jgi:hypothetical protein
MALYSVRLECVQGSSDKFYLQRVVPGGGGAFFVELTYRRGRAATGQRRRGPRGGLAPGRQLALRSAQRRLLQRVWRAWKALRRQWETSAAQHVTLRQPRGARPRCTALRRDESEVC